MTNPPPDDAPYENAADLEPSGTPAVAPEPGDEATAPPPSPGARRPRRLTRSREERWFGGVAGGLAEYWDTDPTLIRVGMVALAFLSGGLAAAGYFVLWLLIPESDHAAALDPSRPDDDLEHRRRGRGMGGVVWGLLLIAGGLAFLVAQLDLDVDLPPWEVGLSAALILVGLFIAIEARRRVPGGLVVLAVILTAVLAAGDLTNFDADIDSGFGNRQERVTNLAQLQDSYSHAFGSMTIDLRDLELPAGTTALEVDIAFGSVDLRLPEGAAYRIEVDGAFSSVDGDVVETGGIALNHSYASPGYDSADRRIHVDLSVVFGSAEVRP